MYVSSVILLLVLGRKVDNAVLEEFFPDPKIFGIVALYLFQAVFMDWIKTLNTSKDVGLLKQC